MPHSFATSRLASLLERVFAALLLLGLAAAPEAALAQEAPAWEIPEPALDTRIAYVSAQGGDDTAAQMYDARDAAVGSDPYRPTGAVQPFATIEAAMSAARSNAPDWVLLKRGDTWTGDDVGNLNFKSGVSSEARFVIGAYGEGPRPLLRAEPGNSMINRYDDSGVDHFALMDLELYSYKRDPSNEHYDREASKSGGSAVRVVLGYGLRDVLLQNNKVSFFSTGLVLAGSGSEDVVLRGNVITDQYSYSYDTGHSSGIYATSITGFVLEGNVFDHNGWLNQAGSGGGPGGKTIGPATLYNHNLYFGGCNRVRIRDNVWLRASSIQIKFRSDRTGSSEDLLVENNLFVEGEVGLSIGGNSSEAHRFADVRVRDNVFLHTGRTQPTDRGLSWGIDISDWDGGTVQGNLLAFQEEADVGNVWAFQLGGASTRNTTVSRNVMYELRNATYMQLRRVDENVSLENNVVSSPSYETVMARWHNGATQDAYALGGNQYFSARDEARWFRTPDAYRGTDVEEWKQVTGAANVSTTRPDFPDPDRSIEEYLQQRGLGSSFGDLVAAVRAQRRLGWNEDLEAGAINAYFREGFGMVRSPGEVVDPEPGLSYAYYAGPFPNGNEPDYVSTAPDARGTSETFDLSAFTDTQEDRFAYRFEGYVEVPESGTYTFYTMSDDGSQLFVGDELVVDNGGAHRPRERSGAIRLAAGRHAVAVTYFEINGGETLDVRYEGPGLDGKQSIPASALSRSGLRAPDLRGPASEPGLAFSYYEGAPYGERDMPDFSTRTPVTQGVSEGFDLSAANRRTEDFAYRFGGYVEVPEEGTYTFYTTSDDGSQLFIGDELVVDNGGLHASRERSGTIGLAAGWHAVRVAYYEHSGRETLGVRYEGPGTSGKRAIPASALSHRPGQPMGTQRVAARGALSATWAEAAGGTPSPRLAWSTPSEQRNRGFVVWRKAVVADAARATAKEAAPDATGRAGFERMGYQKVGFVESQWPEGTSSEAARYTLDDTEVAGAPEADRFVYRIVQVDRDGGKTLYGTAEVEVQAPEAFALEPSFPNPFQETTTIRYHLPEPSTVTLTVHDALGRTVRTLVAGEQQSADYHEVRLEAEGLASGVYFVRFAAGRVAKTQKLVLVR